jgi:hypothetical protein
MQRRDDSWTLSPATARFWALESMADAVPPRRRRLMPAVRRIIPVARRAAGRLTTGPRAREAAPQPATE